MKMMTDILQVYFVFFHSEFDVHFVVAGVEWIAWNPPHSIHKNVDSALNLVTKFTITNSHDWAELIQNRYPVASPGFRRGSPNFQAYDWLTESGTGVLVHNPSSTFVVVIDNDANSQKLITQSLTEENYNGIFKISVF